MSTKTKTKALIIICTLFTGLFNYNQQYNNKQDIHPFYADLMNVLYDKDH